MKIKLYFTFVAISLLLNKSWGVDDDRLTINRLGYGVFFERNGEITDSGGMIYHPVTWSLIMPNFTTPNIDLLNCDETPSEDLDVLCDTVNNLIGSVNAETYTKINSAKKRLEETINLIPLSHASVLISENENEGVSEHSSSFSREGWVQRRKRRKRREVDPGFDDVLEPPDLEVPEWITGGDSEVSSNLEYLIPGRLAGELFTNLFNMPSSSTIKNTESNLRSLGGAIYTNVASLDNLGRQLQYVIQLTDKRMDALESMTAVTYEKLRSVNRYITEFQSEFYNGLNNISMSLIMMNNFKSTIISYLYPQIYQAKLLAKSVDDIVDRWTFGIINLTSGFISEYLVSEEMIKNALNYIKTYSLTLPNFSSYRLMSQEPAFYYRLKKMSYARTENKILITMDVPLYRAQKRMTLYRVTSFPMPVKAGLEGDDIEGKHGFTQILDLPAFLAVSENLESYVELTEAQYLACDSEVKGIQNCGNSVGVPKLTTATHKSCSYSIFSDTPEDVKKYCVTAFTKTVPQGSARQLSSDSSFLIQGGGDTRYWTMTCPASSVRPQTKIPPCSLCRLKVGCGCSVFGTNFRIPTHISGCDEVFDDVSAVTTIYQRNVATLSEFVTDLDLQEIRSYETSINQMFPAFDVPIINFTVPDMVDNFIEVSREYGLDFAKGAQLVKENQVIFHDRAEEALAAAMDFSDQEVDRAGSVLGALQELFEGVFGGEVWQLLAFIFGPLGMSIIGFALAIIMFLPEVIYDIQDYRENKREEREEYKLLTNAFEIDLNSLEGTNYGFLPKITTMLPTRVELKQNDKGEEFYMSV